jgi:hypothetical protein
VVTADIQRHCQDVDSQSLLASALQTVGIRIVHWSTFSSAQIASSLPTIGPVIKNLNVTKLQIAGVNALAIGNGHAKDIMNVVQTMKQSLKHLVLGWRMLAVSLPWGAHDPFCQLF